MKHMQKLQSKPCSIAYFLPQK